jgi:hypothetical protein
MTQNELSELILGNNYVFTVIDVSLDNWVNKVIILTFVVE